MMSTYQKISSSLAFILGAVALSAEDILDFRKDIEPILKEHCIKCHGPDEQESDFRIDRRSTLFGGGGSGIETILPGDPVSSYLIELVREPDEEYRMPYEKDPVPEDQIVLLEKWIEQGASVPEDFESEADEKKITHWALLPVERPAVPKIKKAVTPIDAFLTEKLHEKGLAYNPAADARSLIRRTAILLTGLPPTPEQIESFSKAHKRNADRAFTKLVDDLLESPHFGERWAQHWLDVIRWAETNGSEANLYRKNAWFYRDYVVNAFNEDKPYDQFIREQLAGDQMGAGEATGFIVAGPHVPAATVGREKSAIRQARADRMDEIVQTVGASILGMTVSCARCHNHKFDPISIKDYYSMTAIFQGIEFGGRYPEVATNDPAQKRHEKLESNLEAARNLLRQETGAWQEDWQGWNEVHFAPVKTSQVRVTFKTKNVSIDELDLYGPKNPDLNVAASKHGTVASTPEEVFNNLGPPSNINDGQTGTMNWRPKKNLPEGVWPSVSFEFPEPQEIDLLRVSSNRQYFLETDYLSTYSPKSPLKFTIEVMNEAGEWVELVSTPELSKHLEEDEKLAGLQKGLQTAINTLLEKGPQPSFVGQFIDPVKSYVFHRGSPETPKSEVAPASFDILNGDLGLDSSSPDPIRRLKFAERVTDPEHPLTARVMANRIWSHIFGTGIVATPSDFGTVGAPPTNEALLDWLAAEFVNPTQAKTKAWSVKDFVRNILLTDAYRQSSAPNKNALAKDGSTLYLWRFPPRRIEAEVIRDGILQASGKLDPRLGGKSFRIHNEKKTYAQWEVLNNHGPETWRRMLYQERMRRVDDQIFTAFDFPDCGQIRARRPVSTTPLQALNLMNSAFSVEQSEFIAQRAKVEAKGDNAKATKRLFSLLLGREPSKSELEASIEVAETGGLNLVSRSLINSNEFAFLP